MAASALVVPLAARSTPSGEPVPAYVRRALAGETRAFNELYQLHRRDVARLAARLLGPRGDVDDIVQDVFVQVFRSLPNFRGDSRFSTWLHRVTVNVVLMYLRSQKSRPRLVSDDQAGVEAPTPVASPLDDAASRERLRALYRILDGVGEKKRTVFILHDIEGVSATDVGRIVGAPVLTVRTRLFYARREVYAAMATDPMLDSIAAELGFAESPGDDE